jgi:hypothetical protein
MWSIWQRRIRAARGAQRRQFIARRNAFRRRARLEMIRRRRQLSEFRLRVARWHAYTRRMRL